jgi:hypothetical protein
MNKIFLLVIGCLFLVNISSYAGELYETEEYLAAINVDNPYGDIPPVVDSDFDSFSGGGEESNPRTGNPAPNTGPSNSGGGDNSGSYGEGNFNQFFGFDSGSWTTGTKNQTAIETKDYLTQAILTNAGGFILYRNRGKRYAQTKETTCLESVSALSIVPHRIRAVWDKQVAYKKIQRAVKTPFERCYTATVISDDYFGDGFETFVSITNLSAVTVFNLCA